MDAEWWCIALSIDLSLLSAALHNNVSICGIGKLCTVASIPKSYFSSKPTLNETTCRDSHAPWAKPILIVSISGARVKICAQLECTRHTQCIGRRNPLGIAARRFCRPLIRFIKMKHNAREYGHRIPISHASFGWLREHLRAPRPQVKPHRVRPTEAASTALLTHPIDTLLSPSTTPT